MLASKEGPGVVVVGGTVLVVDSMQDKSLLIDKGHDTYAIWP